MRRLPAVFVAAVLLAAGAAGAHPSVSAQDVTPSAAETSAGGVTVEEVALARIEEMPPAPAALRVVRYRLEPGAALVTDPAEETIAVLYVEQGTLTIAIDDPVTVSEGGSAGTPVAEIAAGTAIELGPGQAIALPPAVTGEIQNLGQEPAVVLASVLESIDGEATPVP